ncbi:zinc uptake protein ZrgA [Poseidonocella sedimentorum]|uniref:Zinc-binding protein n=1 Tax=Poseidonocella sedimentorum TaxID=871652 RepID=A0A1I6ERB2_9RHOB|nr:DUF2796 domain-containing protein [Poseidonocella sedimentorum]SFR20117.1 Protein of unknown function [Poseidonocella sedimentorum]
MKQILSMAALASLSVASVAEAQRSADAHTHGHVELDIAVDGDEVVMALRAPGADIVGFEYVAKSEADKAAVAGAVEQLEDPARLLALTEAAGCVVEHVEVSLSGEEAAHDHGDHEAHDDHDEHEDHEEHADHADHDDHGDHEAGANHNEFSAEYHFHCDTPAALDQLELTYFDVFSRTEEIAVTVLSAGGAVMVEATPDARIVAFPAAR